ncbi:RNA-binding protein [Rubellicoccus peritrichatus]|uniref:RNA-binding protein n=1 Tax=Rubellicoccus peritrichatus TaxID=3080537 RepID=A0AAQ3QVD6_9BACT|nr:RNA-binding protein [Puniceicoccus sp. CR14]WOO40770.1 RNA-binding protein [Puniceicoccus sp. CR14]
MDIYVGNLPYETEEDSLRQVFGEHGSVANVKIIVDHETGRSKGFAFITMSDSSEGNTAIEALNGADFGGRPLKVNEARPREDRPRGNFGGGGGGGYNRGGGGGFNRGGGRGGDRRGNDRRGGGGGGYR